MGKLKIHTKFLSESLKGRERLGVMLVKTKVVPVLK